MSAFQDNSHDPDSCKDVWENLYQIVYPGFFGKLFDFDKLEDAETSSRCKRWYVKLRRDCEARERFPRFKMAGDCIFNFNEKKRGILQRCVTASEEGKELLAKCASSYHSYENFAFMPITGGMNNAKGVGLDRPDVHILQLKNWYDKKDRGIFSHARGNREALEWYLSLFDRIYDYLDKVYLIEDREWIDGCFLPFAKVEINDEETGIRYMRMAMCFWKIREKRIEELRQAAAKNHSKQQEATA